MQKTKSFFKRLGPVSVVLSVVLSVLLVTAIANAATTISTSIVTGGDLTVSGATSLTGLATLLGGATTTTVTLLNGEVISNATDGVIQLGGIASTTSITLLNGETITNATDGTIQLLGIASSTNVVIGGGTTITRHKSATASLDFPVVAANACQDLTITVNGAADGDTVSIGVPTALANASSTLTTSGFVSAANTVTVRICQVAASATSNPAAATVRADVWQH